MNHTLATLPFTVGCSSCKAPPGDRCTTRLRRGYHLSRADKALRADNRRTTQQSQPNPQGEQQ